jgi:putative ABC transport system permease protein
MTGAQLGDLILVETPAGRQRQLTVSGLVHDLNIPAGTFTNQASGYITFDTLEMLGYPQQYNELLLTVDGSPPDPQKISQIASEIGSKIQKSGRFVYATVLTNAGRLWFEPFIAPLASILIILGVVILLVSGFLVINTVTALLAQQMQQIGIMKAVGARSRQIMMMYLVSMTLIGFLALAIAVPLGRLGTRLTVGVITGIINFDVTNYQVPNTILVLQVVLSLFIPVGAALIPILSGARITVREAISDYGLTKTRFGVSLFDRIIGAVRGFPRPFLLSLRNTFRQKSRLLLTLLTLSFGSAIFIAVLSVFAGLTNTLDRALRYYNFDVRVAFSRPYRIEQITNEINRVSGLLAAETWDAVNSRVVFPDGSESDNILVLAPPTDTTLISPTILRGRWLGPDDENAIVVNSDVLQRVPGIAVGDEVVLNIDDKQFTWQVVGIVRSVLNGPTAYVNYPYFARTLGRYGLAGSVYVKTGSDDLASQVQMKRTLEEHFEQVGMKVGTTSTVAELRSTAISQYRVVFLFLAIMAALLTIVGGLGLAGTMGLNVLERTREIGVMRAVGASNGAVMQIVISEGILIGLISWIIGIILAIPASLMMGNAVGTGFLREPLQYTYSVNGAIIWLLVVILLATLASFFPARRAVRMTVRDVLAYE